MGHGGHESLGQTGHLLGQAGVQDLLAQLGPLHGQGDLVGEKKQRLALVARGRVGGQDEQPDRAPGRGQRQDQQAAALQGWAPSWPARPGRGAPGGAARR